MAKRRKRSAKTGLPPGSLVHIGSPKSAPATVSLYRYSADLFEEHCRISVEEVAHALPRDGVKWIEVDGIHDVELVRDIGRLFKIHSLILEDIVNTNQRPKKEDFDDLCYVVVKMLRVKTDTLIEIEQVSFILTNNVLISFQEGAPDVFEPVRQRLRNSQSKLKRFGPDALLYALIDSIVDHYFIVLEIVGESLEALEKELVSSASPKTLPKIYDAKRCILSFRRATWPLREVLSAVNRGDSPFIQKETLLYFRDIYDHVVEILDMIESSRDISSSMIDVYLSSVSNKLNDVMRVLTVITTIFMPLSFIAGVYGMNFQHMPELHWRYGYPAVLFIMFLIALGMARSFRRRGWL